MMKDCRPYTQNTVSENGVKKQISGVRNRCIEKLGTQKSSDQQKEKNTAASLEELNVLPSRTQRDNVTGLHPYVRPEPCAPYPGDPCAQYPDPWLQCDTAVAGQHEGEALARSLTHFAWKAYRTIAKFNKDKNIIISPISLAAALTHLLLGAKNQTQHDLEKALFYTRENGCVHEAFKELLKRTQSLQSASQLFYRQGMCLQKPFLKRSWHFYGNEPAPLIANSSENVRTINSWVAEKTHGKITHLVDQVSADTILMLLNAVYFNGTWKAKFNKKDTKMEHFWVTSDKKVTVPMLQQSTYPLASIYQPELNVKVAKMQLFGKNSLIIIMPQNAWNSLGDTESLLNVDRLTALIDELKTTDYKPTSVMFPKLNLQFKQDLLQPFSDMGLLDVLQEPNLCGMVARQRMEISSAEHRVELTLNEEGVEAAAVTAISVARNVLVFELQRPFLLLLWNDELDVPLFIGRVVDPSQ
ncbi:plasma protease C1 inhibitor-like [Scyliorhinus canicula]|uniref:plasma protease C1 inhibitor-like n=1 Tax=Scyliorhinus canicula TaxID=7830 RepID=UPI0018F4B3FB|nr:plasma protease C1 inhibitor-like [Scyliorhinus canicula]